MEKEETYTISVIRMATSGFFLFLIVPLCIVLGTLSGTVLSRGCGLSCQNSNDCDGRLICSQHGQCDDDSKLGTSLCSGSGSGSGDNGNDEGTCGATPQNDDSCCDSDTCHQTSCSPSVTSSTRAILTVNSFSKYGSGGGASKCDGRFHSNDEKVVALSTGWFDNKKRCGQSIAIRANGKRILATVVDECDSGRGCDNAHANQPPCANNVVDASDAVWRALGVSPSDGEFGFMHITWADA